MTILSAITLYTCIILPVSTPIVVWSIMHSCVMEYIASTYSSLASPSCCRYLLHTLYSIHPSLGTIYDGPPRLFSHSISPLTICMFDYTRATMWVWSRAWPVSQRICSGSRICSGGTCTLADLFRFSKNSADLFRVFCFDRKLSIEHWRPGSMVRISLNALLELTILYLN